ncbi:MAG TPA: preprotein translocase subunit SecG [Burkholderiaceae bacterium]|nr:preprotein translocase subunit SecG [Burkholderiaceae bacterium]
MSVFLKIILIVQILSALGMIGLILVQHGKGADMGAAFGSGGSGSLFGASGSANFLSRTTSILAAVFFVSTLLLTYLGGSRSSSTGSVLEGAAVTAPAANTATPAAVPTTTPANSANQIPGSAPASSNAPAAKPSTVPAASTTTTTTNGAAQIPAK